MKGLDLGVLAVGKSSQEAEVGLMIRLIDTNSGKVIDSQRVEGRSSGGGLGIKVGWLGQQTSHKAPLAQATQEAIDRAVELIAERLAAVPFQARVIRNLGDQLVISAGSMVGAQVGDQFTVYSLGEEFLDPYTGESLGRDEKNVGIVRVTEVKQKYSKASPVGSTAA